MLPEGQEQRDTLIDIVYKQERKTDKERLTHTETDTQREREPGTQREADRKMNRQTDGLTDRQKNGQYRRTDGWTER